MVARMLPVDWGVARAEYAAGLTLIEVARNAGISGKALNDRIAKEGWPAERAARRKALQARNRAKGACEDEALTGVLNAGRAVHVPMTGVPVEVDERWRIEASEDYLAVWPGDTPEVRQTVLDVLVQAGSETIAASCAGISGKMLDRMVSECAVLARQVQMALGHHTLRHSMNIAGAGDRGDWRASETLLKNNRLTRGSYAFGGQVTAGGPNINIAIFDRDELRAGASDSNARDIAPPRQARPAPRVIDVEASAPGPAQPIDLLDVDFLQ